MTESREWPRLGSLGARIGVGIVLALGSLLGGRVRESWETGSVGVRSLSASDYLIAVVAGLVAGTAFHLTRGSGPPSRARHYISWMLASTLAAIPVLTPDILGGRQWTLLFLAPAFGVLVGGGWAMFVRRLSGEEF